MQANWHIVFYWWIWSVMVSGRVFLSHPVFFLHNHPRPPLPKEILWIFHVFVFHAWLLVNLVFLRNPGFWRSKNPVKGDAPTCFGGQLNTSLCNKSGDVTRRLIITLFVGTWSRRGEYGMWFFLPFLFIFSNWHIVKISPPSGCEFGQDERI